MNNKELRELGLKRCSSCKQELLLEDFHKDASRNDGLCGKCKTCTKQYYKDNKQTFVQRSKNWVRLNREKFNRYQREYQQRKRNENKIDRSGH